MEEKQDRGDGIWRPTKIDDARFTFAKRVPLNFLNNWEFVRKRGASGRGRTRIARGLTRGGE